jgi:Family of unknown function (DUF6283)
MARKRSTVLDVRPAGDDHQVLTIASDHKAHRREPCADCPWRVDATGVFPPEAFRHSARTAFDMAQETFGCHSSGSHKPATCAGFLLRGAEHNLKVRMDRVYAAMEGADMDDVHDGGHALHPGYVAMAVANGVDPDDPALAKCRLSSFELEG